ncbi:MAG: bifunctional (p)ppGpp synthetase/guanosine-3',5'-bis(diphosphate) 3'-pyrophosphohydrolase [Candidatus Wallbacteria bacterium]|nr:bifunctional (p)ppGpp synthetase/guanosine-3',5'-bis(diphosphate) 3'-pyrophosphohydrolase [Candidatus Wallbacteria bacterium]
MNTFNRHISDRPDFSLLKRSITVYNPEANWDLLERAYLLAEEAHSGQKRADGTPYFIHPFNVALILTELKMDSTCISAALLHDVVEDTAVTPEYISEHFSPAVSKLISGVTKISKLAFKSRLEQQAENIRKMLLAMSEDIRVILIKLADRLHNISTISALPVDKQKRIAQETLDIYAPLAHRLGMHSFKSMLEDCSFAVLEPGTYERIRKEMELRTRERERYVNSTMELLTGKMKENNVSAKIYGRIKHYYSIYLKMQRTGKKIEEIFDLLAVRIITANVRECYTALGVVHDLWLPMPGRFKDFIALPKQNMYQSLHTTVMQKRSGAQEGIPLEIQIRTEDMEKVAEIGIAAHWDYKETNFSGENSQVNQKIAWLRQLIDWYSEIQDAGDFIHSLKNDLFQDEVFVFTPAGDVVALPTTGTPLDFAFIVHTEVGLRCTGAKVNGKIVPLEYELRNGDVVDIITSNRASPNSSWLKIVKSHKAKNKIRQFLRKKERDTDLEKGRETFRQNLTRIQKEISRLKPPPIPAEEMVASGLLKSKRMKDFLASSEYRDTEELFIAIGSDKLTFVSLFSKLFPEWNRFKETQNKLKQLKRIAEKPVRATSGVIVEGLDNPLIVFSRCCSPIPGDSIIGYITRGKGISVHRKNCPNIRSLLKDKERFIALKWDKEAGGHGSFIVWIRLQVNDRPNMLFDITQLVSSSLKLNIINLRAKSTRSGQGVIDLQIELVNIDSMDETISRLSKIKGVREAFRLK